MISPESLKDKVKNIAKSKRLSSQEVLQMFFFERFLERLSHSKYKFNFVIKGELLISSMIGMNQTHAGYFMAANKRIELGEKIKRVPMGFFNNFSLGKLTTLATTNLTHIETVALLSKLDVDKHIDVEIKLDELDLTSAESKATYAQIKEYILEKLNLKVSTLYIAQIKRKCGIELREHYNKSKKEKQVIPQCTPEKEEAIMDALRHFKMI